MTEPSPWTWNKEHVKAWASKEFGIPTAEVFEENDVDGGLLLTEVNEEVLRESFFIESWGVRKRILIAINGLLQKFPTAGAVNEETSASKVNSIDGAVSEKPKIHVVQTTRPKLLSADEIYQYLDEYMKSELIPKWEKEKKPVLEQSAARFWMKQQVKRRKFLAEAEASCTYILRYRLPRICEALVHAGLTGTNDLRRMSLSLEAAVYDARKLMWQIELVNGERPEAKDVVIHKSGPVKHVVENAESSDESIRSEDGFSSDDNSEYNSGDDGKAMATTENDHLDDFIEYDDEPTKSIFDYGILDNSSPKSVEDDNTAESQKSDASKTEETNSTKDTENSEHREDSKSNVHKYTHKQHARSNSSKRRSKYKSSRSKKWRKMSSSTSAERKDVFTNSDTLSFDSDSDDDDLSDMYGANYYSILGKGHQPRRASSTSSSADQTTLDPKDFPRLIKLISQMSATQIIDAYNKLKIEDTHNMHPDDKAIIEEVELGHMLFADINAGDEEYLNFDKQGKLLVLIQHIISLEATSIPNTRLRRRLRRRRRGYSSSSESDVQLESDDDVALSDATDEESDEDETAESLESSQKENGPKRKKGFFRKVRVDTAEVSAVQSSWKQKLQEAEDRAEAQLQTLDETIENVIVNIGDAETAKHVILLPHLAHLMKPHQIEGIRFMWRQTMMLKTGGVLGHAMGLGKTLQVIAFIHTIFQEIAADNKDLPDLVKPGRILILAPITTLKNWQNEFNKWIPRLNRRLIRDVINLAELKFMPPKQRYGLIEEWYNKGGVLLMGYDNFRSCLKHAQNTDMYKWLQKPGPSLAIIDEGHRIKNSKSQLSSVVKSFETPFRICMTGYPLQNNLEEYYCMIDFIYPGFLGTIGEFRNAYKNPIEQFYEDTTTAERIISKRQLYKLRTLLGDLIHRRDAEILHKELQPKTEFDVCCKLTEEQRRVYELCVDDLRAAYKLQPIQALQVFRNICNHPAAFLQQTQTAQQAVSQRKADNAGGYASTSRFRSVIDRNTQDVTPPISSVQDQVVTDSTEVAITAKPSISPRHLSPSIDARNDSATDNAHNPQIGSGLNENVVSTTVKTSTIIEQQLSPLQNSLADADAASSTTVEQLDTQSPKYVPGSPIMPYQPNFDWYRSSASQQSSMPLISQPASDGSGTPLISNLITIIDDEETALPEECKTLFPNASALVQSISDIHNIELSCKCKVALQLVQQSIEVGDKTLLFSHTIPTLDYLENILKAANIHTLRIDGGTPTPTRQIYVDKFNKQPKWQVFLVSAKAASLGINLVAANRVILFDLDWNPCHDEQAVARAYRFGQRKEVFVYRLQAFGTIEEHIFRLNVHKHGISSRVVDDKTLTPQKQDLKQKYYLKPIPSPAIPLQEAAYNGLTDPVLRATAEICKDDLVKIELHSNYTSEYEQAGLNEQDKKEIEQQLSFEQKVRNGEIIPSPVPSMAANVTYRRPYTLYTPPSAARVPTSSYSSIHAPGSSKTAPIEIEDASPERPTSLQTQASNSSMAFNPSTPLARECESSPQQPTYTGRYQSQKESDSIYLPALGASDMLDYPDDQISSQSQSIQNLPRDYNTFYNSTMYMRGRDTTMQNRPQQNNTSEHQHPHSWNTWQSPTLSRHKPHSNYWQTVVAPFDPFDPSSIPRSQPAQQTSSIKDKHQMAHKNLSLSNPPKSFLHSTYNAEQNDQTSPAPEYTSNAGYSLER